MQYGEAFLKITNGYQDVMIAGGSEFAINPKVIEGFNAMRTLYSGNDINNASIPFDKNRSGFVISEGAGAIVLEELEHAINRNAHIYAEIVGYGSNCDAYHITAPEPNGIYASTAMLQAISEASINPIDIDYINCHGTSTQANDISESRAIKNVFEEDYKKPYVSSTKSMTGHLLSASAIIEAIICCKSLEEGFIPANIGTKEIDGECDLNIVLNQGIRKDIKYVLSNSLGFGGDNTCIVLKKWEK
jgi:3-oxoacyl-[acyl-carrier-protein] synthase II